MATTRQASSLFSQNEFSDAINTLAFTFAALRASGERVASGGGMEWADLEIRHVCSSPSRSESTISHPSSRNSLELRITVRAPLTQTSMFKVDSATDEVDECDPDCLCPPGAKPSRDAVTYSVLLSPTYLVPVLYFWAHDYLHGHPQPASLERLGQFIPSSVRPQVERFGVLGAVSVCNHPAYEFPVYFVHPCNTSSALEVLIESSARPCSNAEYMVSWLGLVGQAVGLSVPATLACTLASKQRTTNEKA